jgi:hypothetical protein
MLARIPGVLNFPVKPDNILDLPQALFYARIAPVKLPEQ